MQNNNNPLCRITTIGGETKITCFHTLREAIKDQGWEPWGEQDKEGDIVTAKYINPSNPDPVAPLAALQRVLPNITPPTDGVFAEATFHLHPVRSYITIKAPAGWLIGWPGI